MGGTCAGKCAFAPDMLMRHPATIFHMGWEGEPPGERFELPFGQISCDRRRQERHRSRRERAHSIVPQGQRTNTRGLRTHLKRGDGKQSARAEDASVGFDARVRARTNSDRPQPRQACRFGSGVNRWLRAKAGYWERTQRAGRFRRCGLMSHVDGPIEFEHA